MKDFPGQKGPMCTWPRVEAVDGARFCLSELSRKAPCCLATNARDSSRSQIRLALEQAGLSAFISEIYCFQTLGMAKPSPDFFKEIIRLRGCDPGRVIMIGDSLDTDVRAAIAAGLKAVWFNREGMPVPDGITAVSSLRELPGIHIERPAAPPYGENKA
ncbi:MAG: HAD family hydrolase [Pseudomonadota bacterium]